MEKLDNITSNRKSLRETMCILRRRAEKYNGRERLSEW